MIKDIDKKPCVLEYSEEQKCWHINSGGNEIASNGYEPLAMGSMHGVRNLKSLVDSRLDTNVTSLAEVREVVWQTLWDFAKLLPDVRYCVEPKDNVSNLEREENELLKEQEKAKRNGTWRDYVEPFEDDYDRARRTLGDERRKNY